MNVSLVIMAIIRSVLKRASVSRCTKAAKITTVWVLTVILFASVSGCIFPEEDETKEPLPEPPQLVAIITVNKAIISPNDTVRFDASASIGDIEDYYWDHDTSDGLVWELGTRIFRHKYTEVGEYTAALKVVDVDGDTARNTTSVYVNYKAEYAGELNVTDNRNQTYRLPVHIDANKAVITLRYDAYRGQLDAANQNDLDFYIYYNESDDSEVANSTEPRDTKAEGSIEETIILTHVELRWNPEGLWRVEVECKAQGTAGIPPERNPVSYELSIEVHYDPS